MGVEPKDANAGPCTVSSEFHHDFDLLARTVCR